MVAYDISPRTEPPNSHWTNDSVETLTHTKTAFIYGLLELGKEGDVGAAFSKLFTPQEMQIN